MYKMMSRFFAIVSLLSSVAFLLTQFMDKGVVLSLGKKEKKQAVLAGNKRFILGAIAKISFFAAPMWFFFNVKSALKLKKKTRKRRRMLLTAAAVAFLALARKKRKLKISIK